MSIKTDILFFGAHPDDIELSSGGTILKYTSSGVRVRIVDLTLGELGTRGTVQLRQKEAAQAGKVLGVSSRENLRIKDGDIENSSGNRLKVIRVIRKYMPEVIFLPYPSDRHPDHINASTLIREGAFYSGLDKIHTKLNGVKQKKHRPAKLVYYMQTYAFEPSFIVDISETFTKKMQAIKCYGSQFFNKKFKGPETFISDKKYMEFIEARAVYYGFQIGAKYGEPFYSEEKLKIDPFSLLK
jgi:bacillithiol biosynthesis deacetylase BshB1